MTREEKIAAFIMRIDGESWYAIAAELGRNVADARGAIIDALRIKRIENSTRERGRIVYPAVEEYLLRNRMIQRGISVARKKLVRIQMRKRYGRGLAG